MDLVISGSHALELLETVFICIRECGMRAIWTAVAVAMGVGLAAGTASCSQQHAPDVHQHGMTTVVASLVVYNGGGYDQWVDDVLSGHPGVTTVNAYSLLPGTVAQPANEHVFYDPTTAKAVAVQIADRLAKADAAHADAYRVNAAEFGKRADEILQIECAIGQTHPGTAVVATEPVAHYLLVNAGITDKTPQGFSSAVEEDADPAPADLAVMLDLINTHQVSALLFNPQTQTAVTKQIQDAAQRASVPVVTVTETLPNGTDYLTWQRQTAQQLASQLDNAPQTNR